MHSFRAALHMLRVDPDTVVISLPRDAWWSLWNAIESKYGNFLKYDGRGAVPDQFTYLGVRFKPLDK